jgi:hypothetical protein
MLKNLTISILLLCQFALFSQTGTLNIKEDLSISNLMSLYIADNQANNKTKGWTVIVASTTDRRVIEEQKQGFLQLFPDINADWYHDKPYYKLRAGAFRRKADALQLLQEIRVNFPACYPAQETLDISLFIDN